MLPFIFLQYLHSLWCNAFHFIGATVLGSFGSYPTTTSPLNRAFSTNSPPAPMDMYSQESVTYIQHNTATSPQPGAFTAFGLGRVSVCEQQENRPPD